MKRKDIKLYNSAENTNLYILISAQNYETTLIQRLYKHHIPMKLYFKPRVQVFMA